MKTHGVLQVSVLFHTSAQTARFLIVVRGLKMSLEVIVPAQRNFLLGQRSPSAPLDTSFECGELVSKFRMLTSWYRTGSSSCCLDNMLLGSKLRLPLLRRLYVVFPRSTCDVVPTFNGSYVLPFSCMHLRQSASFSHLSAQPSIICFCAFRK